ncbi:MAG: hypothetical protein HW421_3931 [Ignavibacteria bacterium]|nr:hypothetical protein [Ignavibacteria bacterium]
MGSYTKVIPAIDAVCIQLKMEESHSERSEESSPNTPSGFFASL